MKNKQTSGFNNYAVKFSYAVSGCVCVCCDFSQPEYTHMSCNLEGREHHGLPTQQSLAFKA